MVPIKSYTAAALYLPLLALGVPLLESGDFDSPPARGGEERDAGGSSPSVPLSGDGRIVAPADRMGLLVCCRFVFGVFSLAMFFWDRILVFTVLVLFMVVIFGAVLYLYGQPAQIRQTTGRGAGL